MSALGGKRTLARRHGIVVLQPCATEFQRVVYKALRLDAHIVRPMFFWRRQCQTYEALHAVRAPLCECEVVGHTAW